MSKLQVDDIVNKDDTGAPGFGRGIAGVVTALSGFSGNVSGVAGTFTGAVSATAGFTGNISGTAATFTGPLTIGGTLTYEDVTNIDSVGLVTARNGLQVLAGITTISGQTNLTNTNITAGILTASGQTNLTNTNVTAGILTAAGQANLANVNVSAAITFTQATETISAATTDQYDPTGTGKYTLKCDARNGTIFTHTMTGGNVGIVSLSNFDATNNRGTTFTILVTTAASGTASIGNTQAALGFGTNMYLVPAGHSGISTSAKVSSASTVTLSTTAGDVDIVSFFVQAGTAKTVVYATNNGSQRWGLYGPS